MSDRNFKCSPASAAPFYESAYLERANTADSGHSAAEERLYKGSGTKREPAENNM